MTATLDDRDLDRVLDAWMDEGPTAASEIVIDAALARVPTARRRARPMRVGQWSIGRMQAFGMPLVVVVAVALIVVVAFMRQQPNVGPDATPSSSANASPSNSATRTPESTPVTIPSRASGVARVEVSGAADLSDEWRFLPGGRLEEFPGLIVHGAFELAGTACGCPGGRYVEVAFDPADPEAYPLEVPLPTSPRLAMRFGFPPDPYVEGEYMNGHLSREGECLVTFALFTEREIEAAFECVDIPSEVNEQHISVVGTFSFDPRDVISDPEVLDDRGADPLSVPASDPKPED